MAMVVAAGSVGVPVAGIVLRCVHGSVGVERGVYLQWLGGTGKRVRHGHDQHHGHEQHGETSTGDVEEVAHAVHPRDGSAADTITSWETCIGMSAYGS